MTREEFVQKHRDELVGKIVFGISSALCDGPTVRAGKILKQAEDVEQFLARCYDELARCFDELRPDKQKPLAVRAGTNGVATTRRAGA